MPDLRNACQADGGALQFSAHGRPDPENLDAKTFDALPPSPSPPSALGRIGAEAKDAVPALIEALNDANNNVRYWAADTLGQIGAEAKDALPALKAMLETERIPWIQEAAQQAIAAIEGAIEGE